MQQLEIEREILTKYELGRVLPWVFCIVLEYMFVFVHFFIVVDFVLYLLIIVLALVRVACIEH